MKVAGGAGNTSRHRQSDGVVPGLSNVRISASPPASRAPAAAAVERGRPAGPCASPLRRGWRRLVQANARLEDSWLGDLIGAFCLLVIFWGFLFLGLIFE